MCSINCLSTTLLLQNNSALENRPPESNLQSQYSLLNSSRTTTKTRNKDKWRQAINSALRSPLELLDFPWCPMSIRSFHLDPGPSWKRANKLQWVDLKIFCFPLFYIYCRFHSFSLFLAFDVDLWLVNSARGWIHQIEHSLQLEEPIAQSIPTRNIDP